MPDVYDLTPATSARKNWDAVMSTGNPCPNLGQQRQPSVSPAYSPDVKVLA